MAVSEITIGAIVHQQCTAISRDRRKAFDLLTAVADAERIVGIDQVDDRGALVDMGLQCFGCQPVVAGGIVDRDLDHLRALLAREQARPFPRRIGGDERCAGLQRARQIIASALTPPSVTSASAPGVLRSVTIALRSASKPSGGA